MTYQKVVAKILNFMPETIRHKIYRYKAVVPDFALDPHFTIEIARTKDDLESSYRLLHDCYVSTKLMSPDPPGLRCNVFTFLPHSTVIVAKYKNEIVGTVSLIRDSIWGLPSDKDYRDENDELRRTGNKLVEVSALAVSKNFRNSGNSVSLLMMKYLYNYSFKYLNSDRLVCTVHPRAEDFYKALWHFDRNGDVVSYQFVQGALAVHLSMEISDVKQAKIVASYPSREVTKNLALFVLQEDSRFKYPSRVLGAQIDPVLTPELFEYFCVGKSLVWNRLTPLERNSLYNLYFGIFGYCNPELKTEACDASYFDRAYRVPTEISATLQHDNSYRIVKLTDLSSGGAFMAWPKDETSPGQDFILRFKIGESTVQTKAEVTWKNQGHSHLQPYGFGIKFSGSKGITGEQIKKLLTNQAC